MVSFQCSPLSTPDGIVGTFRQCAQFQKDKDLDTFVSIVVLDEVGLAEDSPRMPLKVRSGLFIFVFENTKLVQCVTNVINLNYVFAAYISRISKMIIRKRIEDFV